MEIRKEKAYDWQSPHCFQNMSFSSYYPSSSGGGGGVDRGNGDDSGAGSEDGLELQPTKPARSSGSKRSRAAEVHNLSEKRRRSRINEKMKALQNLIPNSNKTDKASMLDEAIEYLKQLQLQVQMLSMRNGLSVHPMYLPGTMQQLQASQLCMGFGENTSAMNMAVAGMLPLNQDTSGHSSFNLSSHGTSSHQPMMLPTNVPSISAPDNSFAIESSHSRHRSFHLRAPAEGMYTEDLLPGQGRAFGQQNENLDNAMRKDDPVDNQMFAQNMDGQEHVSRIVMSRQDHPCSEAL